MDRTRIAYLAGLIDGEGCLQAHHSLGTDRHRRCSMLVELRIEATSERMIETASAILDEMGIRYYCSGPIYRRGGRRPARRLQIHNKGDLQRLLEALRPHLVVKLPEAVRVLEYLDKACQALRYRADASDLELGHDLKLLKLSA